VQVDQIKDDLDYYVEMGAEAENVEGGEDAYDFYEVHTITIL
jgi:hypothetical protein